MVAGAPFSHVSAASAALSMQLRRMQFLFIVCPQLGAKFAQSSLLAAAVNILQLYHQATVRNCCVRYGSAACIFVVNWGLAVRQQQRCQHSPDCQLSTDPCVTSTHTVGKCAAPRVFEQRSSPTSVKWLICCAVVILAFKACGFSRGLYCASSPAACIAAFQA
jgi:hypothetical protein